MAGHTPLQPLCRLCRRHGSGDAAAKLNGRITSRSKSAGRRIGIYGGCSGRRSRRRSGQCLGRTHSDTEHFQSYSHSAHCRHLPLSAANGKARRPVRPNAAGFCLRSSGAAKHHGLNRADARQSDHSGNLGASSGASLSGGGCRHRLRRPVFLQPSRCRRVPLRAVCCRPQLRFGSYWVRISAVRSWLQPQQPGHQKRLGKRRSEISSFGSAALLPAQQSSTLFRLRAAFLHLSEIRQTA